MLCISKNDKIINTYVHIFMGKLNNIVNIINRLDEELQNKIVENIIDKDNNYYEIEI